MFCFFLPALSYTSPQERNCSPSIDDKGYRAPVDLSTNHVGCCSGGKGRNSNIAMSLKLTLARLAPGAEGC